jgi:membrane protease subunit (stomatin/prohibitin family)
VVVRDRELGEVSLRVSGFYTFRIVDPLLCLGTISPEEAPEGSADLSLRLCERIQGRLEDLLPRRLDSLRELPHHFNELATELRLELQLDMDRMGIQLIDFFLTTLHPEEPRLGIAGGNMLLLPQAIKRASHQAGGGNGSREPADAVASPSDTQPVCAHCERAAPEGARFCPWCGLSLSGDA